MPNFVITPKTLTIEAESEQDALDKVCTLFADRGPALMAITTETAVVEAVRLYADPESYWAIFITPDRPAGLFADDVGCVEMDGEHDHRHGRAARRALGNEWWGTEPCEEMQEILTKEEQERQEQAQWNQFGSTKVSDHE